MKQYKEKNTDFILSYKDGFKKEPQKEIKSLIAGEPCIYSNEVIYEEIKDEERESRKEFAVYCTNLHKSTGKQDFNKEIDEYPTARLQKVNDLIRRAKEIYNERDDYLLERDKEYMYFKHIFPDGDTTEYINFIKSDYFKYIPWKDIEYISSYLPYCNYMLIDCNQFKLLKKYKLDERFKTEVYSLKTYKDLINVLNTLKLEYYI